VNGAAARRDLVRYSRAMHAAGWVANHDGNLSARLAEDRFICTPTAFSKADVGLEDLLVVDATGTRLSGPHKPFSELVLHLAVYAARSDAHAVVHAHPPSATAFGAAGQTIPHPFLPEAVVSLGAELPLVPLTLPGKPGAAALAPFVRRCDAVCIAGNGVLTWGPDLETAWLRMELVEHLARMALAAAPLGGVKRLPDAMTSELVGRRVKAGLGAPDEGRPQGAASPAPSAPASADDAAARATQKALAGMPNADPALVARLAREIAARVGNG
jgi:L-fuculose-phosphate aldolase